MAQFRYSAPACARHRAKQSTTTKLLRPQSAATRAQSTANACQRAILPRQRARLENTDAVSPARRGSGVQKTGTTRLARRDIDLGLAPVGDRPTLGQLGKTKAVRQMIAPAILAASIPCLLHLQQPPNNHRTTADCSRPFSPHSSRNCVVPGAGDTQLPQQTPDRTRVAPYRSGHQDRGSSSVLLALRSRSKPGYALRPERRHAGSRSAPTKS